jgi:shikimate dehydrogenase
MIRGAVIGGNVSKSRSPAIHAAAFKALGIEGSYDRHDADAAGFRRLIARLGAEGYAYLNVTIPHKRAAADLADSASPLVKLTAAANTLIFRRSKSGGIKVRAENTDGYGLIAALADAGVKLKSGDRVVLLGSGGAAAGGLAALVATGASVSLVARRVGVGQALRRRFPVRARARITVVPWTATALAGSLRGAVALISSVPAAVFAEPDAARGLDAMEKDTVVLEMAYGDATPLRALVETGAGRARKYQAKYQDGLPMLVHQAARTLQLVLGDLPPAAPMMRAARRPPRPTLAPPAAREMRSAR